MRLFEYKITDKEQDILTRRIDIKGAKHQKIKCVEELSELIQVLSKDANKTSEITLNKIAEETADSLLMISQIHSLYPPTFTDKVQNFIKEKLKRLDERNQKYL